MSDHAYDISHLLELDAIKSEPTELRIVRTPPPSREPVVVVKTTGVAEAQDALAKELLESAAIHEALIQQYLRICGDMLPDSAMH